MVAEHPHVPGTVLVTGKPNESSFLPLEFASNVVTDIEQVITPGTEPVMDCKKCQSGRQM